MRTGEMQGRKATRLPRSY